MLRCRAGGGGGDASAGAGMSASNLAYGFVGAAVGVLGSPSAVPPVLALSAPLACCTTRKHQRS